MLPLLQLQLLSLVLLFLLAPSRPGHAKTDTPLASVFAAFPILAVPAASVRCGDGTATAAVVLGSGAAAGAVVDLVVAWC